jgi:iduronate 2-sulfatase
MNRRDLLRGIAALATASTCAPRDALARRLPPSPQERGLRPDVLLILLDDASPQRIACYGDPVAQTPHLDALFASGLRFDAAHCNSPVCNPSRVSLLTGLRPETTGIHKNDTDWREVLPEALTFPNHFRQQGYHTVAVGKINHATFPDPRGWTQQINPGAGLPGLPRHPGELRGPGTLHEQIKASGRLPPNVPLLYGPSGLQDHEHYDACTATQYERFLAQAPTDKPLFTAVGFHAPHLPFTAPQAYFDRFPLASVRVPENPPGDRDDILHEVRGYTAEEFPPAQAREVLQAFHATQTFLDTLIGRVTRALEASGRADRTIIALTSDHGFMLGEHDMWMKTVFFEECTRVPLCVRVPWLVPERAATSSLVELVDLMPTLTELAGLPPNPGVDGRSMLPLLRDPKRAWKKAAIQHFTPTRRSIVDGRWRLSIAGQPDAFELYDRKTDPREFTNLANDPAHRAERDRLLHTLEAGWTTCQPDP